MYVCVCNAIRGRDLRRAVQESGETDPEPLYQFLGKSPVCGRCLTFAREYVAAICQDAGLRSVDFAREHLDTLDGTAPPTIDSRA